MTEEDEAFHWVETESKLRQHLIHNITHKTDPVEDFRARLAQAIEAMMLPTALGCLDLVKQQLVLDAQENEDDSP